MKEAAFLVGLIGLCTAQGWAAGATQRKATTTDITVGVCEKASTLETFAAQELRRYLRRLFDADVTIAASASAKAPPTFLIGASSADFNGFLGDPLPHLEEQQILLRKVRIGGVSVFVICGGSDRAVLWGVYELIEHYGVRYLLHGDCFPENPGAFYLPDLNQILTPNLATRCWRLVNGLAMGPESWGLKENEDFVDQLAKMKFNRIFLSFWPWQSYSDFEFHGVSKTTGVSFFGYRLPVTADMVGRDLFGDLTQFENPEFVGAKNYQGRLRAARRLARGILARGKSRGMEVGITVQPLEFPAEFQSVLPGSQKAYQLGGLTIGPGPNQSIDDPVLSDLVATVIRSYVRDYPEADWLHLMMPEHRGWLGEEERAWGILNQRYLLEPRVTVAELRAQARRRTTYAAGDRAERELLGDIAALYFFDRVIKEKRLLARLGKEDVRLAYMNVSEELLPYLPKLLPPHGEVVCAIDYTASEVAKQVAVLRRIPARRMPTNLIYTLADDNVGVLPQVATSSLHLLNQELRESGWQGYYTRYWMIGDLDPTVHYLAKASWDGGLTPVQAYRDLIGSICGPAAERPFAQGLDLIEEATNHINKDAQSLAFPVPDMMLKFYREVKGQASPMPGELQRDLDLYRQALASVRLARQLSAPRGLRFADYFIGRLEFAVHYLEAVQLVRKAGTAEGAHRRELAIARLDEALEKVQQALQAFAEVARDNSDRGAIAILNDYAYRSVRDLRRRLEDQPQLAH